MPFEEPISRPLTSVGVHAYAPAVSGVYGISNAREWIYIGETDNIQSTHTSIRTRSTPSRAFRECFGSPAEMAPAAGLSTRTRTIGASYRVRLVAAIFGRAGVSRRLWNRVFAMDSRRRVVAFSQRQLFCNYVIQHSG